MSGVLVLNAGSSSLKFALYEAGPETLLRLKGAATRLGGSEARLRIRVGEAVELDRALPGPMPATAAAEIVFDALAERGHLAGLDAIGHRIVHGGRTYTRPCRLDGAVLADLRRLTPLAPLHQPYNLDIVEAAALRFPDVPQVGCFDTAFHADRPRLERLYGLPRALADDGVLAYGFHGLSYEYVAGVLRQRDPATGGGRAIVAHLGSGASLCAMRDGRSVATTMGFSALEGLVMSTRSGSLDPGVILHLIQDRGMSADQVTTMLYQESGLLGVSGLSGDMLTLSASPAPEAAEAIDLFVYRVSRQIGSLVAALGGLDMLVFTAGIGENAPDIRARICASAGWLGVAVDPARNAEGAGTIAAATSKVEVLVVPTDEERAVAQAALRVLESRSGERCNQ
ncbi:acetate/propionate family kinase [Phenylobacterium sp. SCN 70-31]|uniref:acetate/propionate family kinase n=1 Tax=Phenylobacterium sp. SCN 70-31 TaxID=1660129 RepID=UPI00086CFD2F|nr:acetate/propionate family kinase [Phenylobacterium sp. SCN 70-31]ODT89888.1 MAG: acetate kinase [Phenylobacterium sp. SCN 70-31]